MRQDVYRAAFDEANNELTEILNKFDQLRQRKDRIEKVVEMLKPMAGAEEGAAPSFKTEDIPAMPEAISEPEAESESEPVPEPEVVEVGAAVGVGTGHNDAESTPEPMQSSSENSHDPFQRRIDSALGLSGGLRDSREFGRRFNGTFQRG